MNKEAYFESIISTIENNIDTSISSKKAVFVNNHSNFVLSKNIVETSVHYKKDEYYLLSHTFKSDTMQAAYEPFMDWIRDIYINDYKSHMSEVEFLNECDVYYNQLEVFVSYLKRCHCMRKEDVIMHEVKYEKEKFLISLNIR